MAALVAFSSVVPAVQAAQIVAPAVTPVVNAVPTAVVGIPFGSLAPLSSPLSHESLPNLGGNLTLTAAPALSLSPSVIANPVLPQAGRNAAPAVAAGGPTARTLTGHERRAAQRDAPKAFRPGLRLAQEALGQDQEASRQRPSISNLGSDIAAPSADSSLDQQKVSAEEFFNKKTSLDGSGVVEPMEYRYSSSYYDSSGPDYESAPKKKRGKKEPEPPPPPPEYPAENVQFNGIDLPSVAMRPDRPIAPLIIQAIGAAKAEIFIALYEFRNRDILKALREAKERGVKIHVVVDFKSAYPAKNPNAEYWPQRSMELQSLIDEDFDVTILRGIQKYGIMHNKIAVFDGKLGLFGSYNWSYTSENNHFENINFVNDAARVAAIKGYWDYLRGLSAKFEDSRTKAWPRTVPTPPKDAAPSVQFNGTVLPSYVFTPDASAEDVVIKALNAAKTSIDVSMFTLSSPRITQALLDAKSRKVKVRVLVDRSQSTQSFMKPYLEWMAYHKIPVKTLAGPNPNGPQWAEKNHNKLMILDGKLVLTGSLNHTKSGFLTNFENMFLLTGKTEVAAFVQFYEDMYTSRLAQRVEAPDEEPQLPSEADLIAGLEGDPEPLPPPPTWPKMPAVRQIAFNGETLPSSAVRPQDPLKDLLVKAVDASQKTVELALYEFNLDDILEALRRAKTRGVQVRIILDHYHVYPKGKDHWGDPKQRNKQIQALMDEGFEVRSLRGVRAAGIMHNKYAVFDKKMVEFGSYNWAYTAERNHFENLKFEDEAGRVAFYAKVWDWMWSRAVDAAKAGDHDWREDDASAVAAPVDTDKSIDLNGQKFPRQVFSPNGGVEELVVAAIRAAKATIDIAMFSFYSVRIAEELLLAKERGVHVRLVLDRMQSKLMKLDDWFAYHDFDVRIAAGPDPYGNVYYEKMHNKYLMADGKLLMTGSFNYTGSAEKNNYENIGIYDTPLELAFYQAFFEMMFGVGSKPLKPTRPPENMPAASEFFDPARLGFDEAALST
ncbi:MAG: hypothetical protein A2X36_09580 [Elusimicrobia bacterium GWA2_69_24]|nr:MAG: hypothetical protein A2X36_09580 [Elusimicrobia bacterium GWA2_69_24]HBL17993.1 hypothetical protein [Elusimicrobiota bacterium]